MIEGLLCEVNEEELRVHLFTRSQHHHAKAIAYQQQADEVAALGKGAAHMSNDPSSSLAQSAETHRQRAAFFNFLAEHLVSGETYRLSEQDLIRVEFAGKYL